MATRYSYRSLTKSKRVDSMTRSSGVQLMRFTTSTGSFQHSGIRSLEFT